MKSPTALTAGFVGYKRTSMEPIIQWNYFNHLRHYANLYGNFMVHLEENQGSPNDMCDTEKKRICSDVLNPLCELADSVYLYGKFSNKELDSYSDISYQKKRGKVQILDKKLTPYIDFLDTTRFDDLRGSVLFQLTLNEGILSRVFKNCYDPSVMAGMGSNCTKSAIKYAKSKMSDSYFYAILSEVNSGFEWLFFLANKTVFLELTEIAGKYCKVSQGFINCYGPGVKLAPMDNEVSYGTGFAE
jgi:hypothetical protein